MNSFRCNFFSFAMFFMVLALVTNVTSAADIDKTRTAAPTTELAPVDEGGGVEGTTSLLAGENGFSCSPHTQRCRCKGTKDCKYLTDSIASCKLTCTGKGSKKSCECQLPKSIF